MFKQKGIKYMWKQIQHSAEENLKISEQLNVNVKWMQKKKAWKSPIIPLWKNITSQSVNKKLKNVLKEMK